MIAICGNRTIMISAMDNPGKGNKGPKELARTPGGSETGGALAASAFLIWGALFLGIAILLTGIYAIAWGLLSGRAAVGEETMSQGGGCMIALGLVIMATGGLFVGFFVKKRKGGSLVKKTVIGMKSCPHCSKRVEEDQKLCYHCGHEFKT